MCRNFKRGRALEVDLTSSENTRASIYSKLYRRPIYSETYFFVKQQTAGRDIAREFINKGAGLAGRTPGTAHDGRKLAADREWVGVVQELPT